ncbi:synaptotagmin-like protein 2 isoform X4 [Salarias fasciatus]|uniref:synaptotagmin-like protein 2 isoform X4 n=1 Tax=Salarias fasciatus TaxID=181472 RepID=UPI001176D382|nr:synaptotagmin-like protein 2 isoform X4 [Salarias fasciatus]
MIDLSYLTEEEQDAIRAVLHRDAELKRVEEQRVQNLQRTVSDRFQLRYLTGEWFYETKQLRHQDRIHGCDLIRASMRHVPRPPTLQELCQTRPETSSFVCSQNKDVFVPPVLRGLLQEPEQRPGPERSENQSTGEPRPGPPKPVLLSPTKRRNPFDSSSAAVQQGEPYPDGQFDGTPAAGDGQSERSTSIMSALKWFSSRNPSSAKSLENLSSQAGGQQRNGQRDELNLSVDDVSSLPPSEQMRTSVSVPVFQQDETDSDGTLETGVRNRRNTSSSTSNISISSGMASMSSVSGSTGSLFPAEVPEAQVEVQGSVQFAVNYIQKLEEFQVFVVLCRGLAAADGKRSRSDPYVKCYLLPDKTRLGKRKTSVKKKTVNPTYHEILRFKVPMEVLKTQNLNLSVWHNDTFGRNSFLGEAELDLSQWDFSNTHINDYLLTARVSGRTSPSRLADGRGRMRVALRFLPQTSHSSGTPGTPGTARTSRTSRVEAGEVQIWVKDCKNLPSVRGIVIDPFVKCAVLPDTSRKSRQKTRVVKRTASPMFNHTMVYDGFRPEDLREACAEITVWDHDRINSRYVGGLRLGLGSGKSYGVEVTWMDSSPAEADLWRRMLQLPGEWVEDVLPLRTLVLAKNM